MQICFITTNASALENYLTTTFDSHEFRFFLNLRDFSSQASSSQYVPQRIVLIDTVDNRSAIPTLGTFLHEVHTNPELIVVVKAESDASHYASLNYPTTCVIVQASAPTAPLFETLINMPFTGLQETRGISLGIEAPKTAQRVEYSSAPSIELPSLSLASAGSKHVDTGFLSDEEDADIPPSSPSPSSLTYPTSFDTPPLRQNGFMESEAKYTVVLSPKSSPGATYSRNLAQHLASKGTVLVVDLHSTNHSLENLISSMEGLSRFQPRIQTGMFYSESTYSVATNGEGTRSTPEDLRYILESAPDYDYIIFNVGMEFLPYLYRIQEFQQSTQYFWLFQGTSEGFFNLMNSIYSPSVIPTPFLRVFSTNGWLYPVGYDGTFQFPSNLIWNRYPLTRQIEALR